MIIHPGAADVYSYFTVESFNLDNTLSCGVLGGAALPDSKWDDPFLSPCQRDFRRNDVKEISMTVKIRDHQNVHIDDELLQYRDLFRFAPVGIVRTTVDGEILIGNQAFAEMLGYADFDELLALAGSKILDLYEDPQDRERLLAHHRQSNSTAPFRDAAGGQRMAGIVTAVCMCAQSSTAKEHFSSLKVLSRISAVRKKLKQALKESAERYRSVFENTGTATIIIENDTTVSLANESFTALSGYSKEDIEGKMHWPVLIAKKSDRERMLALSYCPAPLRRQYSHRIRIHPPGQKRQPERSFSSRRHDHRLRCQCRLPAGYHLPEKCPPQSSGK